MPGCIGVVVVLAVLFSPEPPRRPLARVPTDAHQYILYVYKSVFFALALALALALDATD